MQQPLRRTATSRRTLLCSGIAFLILTLCLAWAHTPAASADPAGPQVLRIDMGSRNDVAADLLVQPDGGIVVVGNVDNGVDAGGWPLRSTALARVTGDGRLDAAFGAGGRVIDSDAARLNRAVDILFQPDHGMVVASLGHDVSTLLTRFSPTGELDRLFLAPRQYGAGVSSTAAASTSDGRIATVTTSVVDDFFGLWRFEANGALDASFGQGGKLGVYRPGYTSPKVAAALVQPDGKILVGGSATQWTSPPVSRFLILRTLADGRPDPAFGDEGVVMADFTAVTGVHEFEYLYDIALLPDGRILAVGGANGDQTAALLRLLPDGSLDPSFGRGGRLILPDIAWLATAAIQPDGRMLVLGSTLSTRVLGRRWPYVLARLNPDGSRDPSFGQAGLVHLPVEFDGVADSLVLRPDGKLVVAGTFVDAATQDKDFALMRFGPDGSVDAAFGKTPPLFFPIVRNDP